MNKNALIVFVKNPIAGQVKTRLAREVGDTKAVEVYKKLLLHTHDVVEGVDADKYVFYGDYINEDDLWGEEFYKALQVGDDLGERMLYAFKTVFEKGYERVAIIGSDCYELNIDIIEEAFRSLETHDTVTGPTTDGGYYLLGMTQVNDILFENIAWSTDTVYHDTIKAIQNAGLSGYALKKLSDVDYLSDVPENWL